MKNKKLGILFIVLAVVLFVVFVIVQNGLVFPFIIVFVGIGISMISKSKKEVQQTSKDVPSEENLKAVAAALQSIVADKERYEQLANEKEQHNLTKEDLMTIFAEQFAPNADFYSVPNSEKFVAYFDVINKATPELYKYPSLLVGATGFDTKELEQILYQPEGSTKNMELCALIYLMGKYSVIKDALYCVDFTERVPNCIAIYLLLIAQKMPKEKRVFILDAGDGCDSTALATAIDTLKVCDPSFECKIY